MKYYQGNYGYQEYDEDNDGGREEFSHTHGIRQDDRIFRLPGMIDEINVFLNFYPAMRSIRKSDPLTVVADMGIFFAVMSCDLKVLVDLGIGLKRAVGREVLGNLEKML